MSAPSLSQLGPFGAKITSQNDEDGIIEKIFSVVAPQSKTFVEFGIGPNYQDPQYEKGLEGNCVQLRAKGWKGIFLDGGVHPKKYDIRQEFITPLNINSILRKYKVSECDILSIDVDGQDFWIWMAVSINPTLVIIEYNPNWFRLDQRKTVLFDPSFRWDGTKYYGASLGALITLATDRGYTLVYANGVNAFFLRTIAIANPHDFNPEKLNRVHDQHMPDHLQRPWVTV